ncbi:hypothetical protein SLEP1_g35389 [Rubroshorea leprosula]|uniref:Aspartate/glutamate/uridylate kinase domain-containing protein n=1 Tax=Rubroshorea leprosula TaxID=152421 RepID=A0AAV5KN33_9ROSI|nr:hypothetical protein SLEP1_g35389 [Rubroshorea leprosula]
MLSTPPCLLFFFICLKTAFSSSSHASSFSTTQLCSHEEAFALLQFKTSLSINNTASDVILTIPNLILRLSLGRKPKIIEGKIEALQVFEEKKSAVGRKGARKETAAEIKSDYMTCDIITANPIPGTATYTFLPRLSLRIRFVMVSITSIRIRSSVIDGKGSLELQQSKSLLMRPKVSMVLKIFKEQGRLEYLPKGIAMMKELTLRTQDYLVSFGECMSTRIFAAYLNKIGVKARQYDAFNIGFITTDDFTNADILEATYLAVAKRLNDDWFSYPAIPVVSGFLGKVLLLNSCGGGGSDLIATTIGKALGLQEIQAWKDVDGVLTCDPNINPHAEPVPYLAFEEAAELTYCGAKVLHPLSMGPAMEGEIPVKVKNSYNPTAPGTIITRDRDMSEVCNS